MGTRGYPLVSKYPWITRIEIPARIWVRVPYLSNGAGTDIITTRTRGYPLTSLNKPLKSFKSNNLPSFCNQ